MDPKSELKTIQARMAVIVDGYKSGGNLSDEQATELQELNDRATELKAAILRAEKSAANMHAVAGEPIDHEGDRSIHGAKGYLDFSPARVKSLAKSIANPGIKALIAGGSSGTAVPLDPKPVPLGLTGPNAGFLSLFKTVQRTTPSYKYLRQTARASNAAVVAPGALKPTSVYTATEVTNSLAVIAHLSEQVDKFLLEDSDELEQFLATELTNGVIRKAEAEAISTILGTSGILTYATSADYTPAKGFDGIFSGMAKLGTVGGFTANLVVINSADYETLRLAKNGENDYYGGGPFTGGPNPGLWGVTTFVTSGIAEGTALVLDTDTIQISTDNKGIRTDVDAATGFDKNQVRFRTEGRFATDVKQPSGILKVTLTA